MAVLQLHPEIRRRDNQAIEVLGEIGQFVARCQHKVKVLAHGRRHQEEHVPSEGLAGAEPLSSPEGQRDIQLQAELALCIEEPFGPELLRIRPDAGIRMQGIQTGHNNGVLGEDIVR